MKTNPELINLTLPALLVDLPSKINGLGYHTLAGCTYNGMHYYATVIILTTEASAVAIIPKQRTSKATLRSEMPESFWKSLEFAIILAVKVLMASETPLHAVLGSIADLVPKLPALLHGEGAIVIPDHVPPPVAPQQTGAKIYQFPAPPPDGLKKAA